MQLENGRYGKVILAGAGPGAPDLITVRAQKAVQAADVIIVDRLVSPDIIKDNAKAEAEVVLVGKQNGNSLSTPQSTINDLLVHHATQGRLVVRLKGGDIAFFSNVLDELQTLIRNGIPFEIVPGITSASGASAYAGIPLTARGYSAGVRFLTFHGEVRWDDSKWVDLATTDDTLVFYMSSESIRALAGELLQRGIDSDKQMAIVEQATTPAQRVLTGSVPEFANGAMIKVISPALVIVGRVVSLHNEFKWIADSSNHQAYFKHVGEEKTESIAGL